MKTIDSKNELDRNTVSTLAYLLWEKAGRPHGRDLEFWAQAERKLLATKTPAAAELKAVATTPRSRSLNSSTPPKSRKKPGRL